MGSNGSGAVMDLKALVQAVKAVMSARPGNQSFSVNIEAWCHERPSCDGGYVTRVEVSIWDGGEHYRGPTPEVALQFFLAKRGRPQEIPSEVILPEPTERVATA